MNRSERSEINRNNDTTFPLKYRLATLGLSVLCMLEGYQGVQTLEQIVQKSADLVCQDMKLIEDSGCPITFRTIFRNNLSREYDWGTAAVISGIGGMVWSLRRPRL